MIRINTISNNKKWNLYIKNPNNFVQKKIKNLNKKFNKFKEIELFCTLYLSDDNEIKKLNKKFRKKNKTTDVLSFPFYNKKELKYYDRFPLVLVFDFKPNGFIGCNFHYLPPLLRAKLMDEIDKAKGINWKALSRIKEIKPTVKRYLYKHISSKVVEIEDDEREIALFLPTERFKKEDKLVVWGDSRRMI